MLLSISIADLRYRAEWRPPADVPPAPAPEEIPAEEPGEMPPGSDPLPPPETPESRAVRQIPAYESH